jgi:hypothetical protein
MSEAGPLAPLPMVITLIGTGNTSRGLKDVDPADAFTQRCAVLDAGTYPVLHRYDRIAQ